MQVVNKIIRIFSTSLRLAAQHYPYFLVSVAVHLVSWITSICICVSLLIHAYLRNHTSTDKLYLFRN